MYSNGGPLSAGFISLNGFWALICLVLSSLITIPLKFEKQNEGEVLGMGRNFIKFVPGKIW